MDRVLWITGMPRSGTNWIGQIVASHPAVRFKLCPLFSYEFKNALDEHSGADDWEALLQATYLRKSEYLDQDYLRRDGLVPDFAQRQPYPPVLAIKSTRHQHLLGRLLELVPYARVLAIVRDPRAAIHSWLSNPKEFPTGADPMAEWRSGACRKDGIGEFWGFDDWKMVTCIYLDLAERFPTRFQLTRYEDWVRYPCTLTAGVLDGLNLSMHEQTIGFLHESQHTHLDHPRAVFKSPQVSSRWQGALDPRIAMQIEKDLSGSALATFLS